jgi:hypothetical protein
MNNIKSLLTSAILVCSFSVQAGSTGPVKIEWIKAQGNGIHMLLKPYINNDSNITCGPAFFMSSASETNYQTKVSMLLTAHTRQSDINISYDKCSQTHVVVGDVELVN